MLVGVNKEQAWLGSHVDPFVVSRNQNVLGHGGCEIIYHQSSAGILADSNSNIWAPEEQKKTIKVSF